MINKGYFRRALIGHGIGRVYYLDSKNFYVKNAALKSLLETCKKGDLPKATLNALLKLPYGTKLETANYLMVNSVFNGFVLDTVGWKKVFEHKLVDLEGKKAALNLAATREDLRDLMGNLRLLSNEACFPDVCSAIERIIEDKNTRWFNGSDKAETKDRYIKAIMDLGVFSGYVFNNAAIEYILGHRNANIEVKFKAMLIANDIRYVYRLREYLKDCNSIDVKCYDENETLTGITIYPLRLAAFMMLKLLLKNEPKDKYPTIISAMEAAESEIFIERNSYISSRAIMPKDLPRYLLPYLPPEIARLATVN